MQSRSPLSARLGAAAVSTLVALGLAVAWWSSRSPPVTVTVVDRSEAFGELLDARAAGAEGAAAFELVWDAEARAELLEAMGKAAPGNVVDATSLYRLEPDVDRWQRFPEHPGGGYRVVTDSRGLRDDAEVRADGPGLRVLVTGDSHTDGVCANAESFAHLLGEQLRAGGRADVETLNAGVGGYNLYHYLGVLERDLELEPDVFVVAVYGGNDFSGALKLQRFFNRRPKPRTAPFTLQRVQEAGFEEHDLQPQQTRQLAHFLNNREDLALAAETAIAIGDRIAELCAARGVAVVFVYVPPPLCGQPARYPAEVAALEGLLQSAGLPAAPSDLVADAWLAHLAARGVLHLDLRPEFRASAQPLYWSADSHLNLAAHRRIAELLAPRVEAALAARAEVPAPAAGPAPASDGRR